MTDWGVPDWKNAAAYSAKTASTGRKWNDLKWRWEFLRRRPDYRAAWTHWAPIEANRLARASEALKKAGSNVTLVMGTASTDDPDTCREHFQLTGLLDPRCDFDEFELWGAFCDADEERDGIRYLFDLKKPIAPQMSKAEKLLKALQENERGGRVTNKPHRDLWPLYLRALDAKNARATLAEMAAGLWPDQVKVAQSARDTLNAAREVRDYFPL